MSPYPCRRRLNISVLLTLDMVVIPGGPTAPALNSILIRPPVKNQESTCQPNAAPDRINASTENRKDAIVVAMSPESRLGDGMLLSVANGYQTASCHVEFVAVD